MCGDYHFLKKCSPQETWPKSMWFFAIFDIKLSFYVDIQLCFLENVNPTLINFFIKDIYTKCLEIENNRLI